MVKWICLQFRMAETSDNTVFTHRSHSAARSARGISMEPIQADNPTNLTATRPDPSGRVLGFVNTRDVIGNYLG
ncbi:hypothetical protein SD71_12575 [Cohnella kolymensis]|uniref:CBS domain-containing protein n=1 Tax=Cohnella kolymensis TaxID=1590652 RepID=A0ABR5A3J4_9BACL|nr:hypothetical protein SD71_12575 [Cohnella kolymensis]